jgi:hypothetical protein
MSDVAGEILKHQERVREIATRLVDDAKVKVRSGTIAVRVPDLGGSLVHNAESRVVVSDNVGAMLDVLDGKHDVATLVYDSRRARGEIVEGLAMLVAAGLADIRD